MKNHKQIELLMRALGETREDLVYEKRKDNIWLSHIHPNQDHGDAYDWRVIYYLNREEKVWSLVSAQDVKSVGKIYENLELDFQNPLEPTQDEITLFELAHHITYGV